MISWIVLVFVTFSSWLGCDATKVDPDDVVYAWLHGWSTALIATSSGVTQRRVQGILASAGVTTTVRLPVHPHLRALVHHETSRHGANYGLQMLLGALRSWYPGFSFPRRVVQAALYAANPAAHEARRWWAHRRIVRGI